MFRRRENQAGRDCIPIKILSLLSGVLEERFCRTLVGREQMEYFRARMPTENRWPALLDRQFWSRLSVESYDLIIFELGSTEVGELLGALEKRAASRFSAEPTWSRLPTATVVLLKDADRFTLERAVQLGFDGVWTLPLEREGIAERLPAALERAGRRRYRIERYDRVRRLCRQVNHKRRQLRDKVDILCRDLINSNIKFTETLQDLQRAYDFQSSLMGEFDGRYMLYKALGGIKIQLDDCGAAIYLGNRGEFAAHIAGVRQPNSDDPAKLEAQFTETIVEKVLKTNHSVLVSDGKSWSEVSAPQRSFLSGWSLLGLPIIYEGELIGVVIIYRQASKKLSEKDRNKIQPLLGPLAQAIVSLEKLEQAILSR